MFSVPHKENDSHHTEIGWKKEETIERKTTEEGDNRGRAIDKGIRTCNVEENPFRAIAMTSLVGCDPKSCHRISCFNPGLLLFVELWNFAWYCR